MDDNQLLLRRTLTLVGIPSLLFIFCGELVLFRRISGRIYYVLSVILAGFSFLMLSSCSTSWNYVKRSNENSSLAYSNGSNASNFLLLSVSFNGLVWFLLMLYYGARSFCLLSEATLRRQRWWAVRGVIVLAVVNAAGVNVIGVLAVDLSSVMVAANDNPLTPLSSHEIMNYSLETTQIITPTERPPLATDMKRVNFCLLYSEYEALCREDHPAEYEVETEPLPGNNISHIPLAVVATNRITRLHRSLYNLLKAPGANRSLITVFLDGDFPMQVAVTELFGVNVVCNPVNSTGMYRINEIYKYILTRMFDLYPDAPYILVLEDDLESSPDFFFYFSQTFHIMEEDKSIYCISAWNDYGYRHSAADVRTVFRVNGMPGLGWMLSRSLYKDELEAKWPNETEPLSWDGWMREDAQLQGRDCIVPEVSRTYHFDKGLHITAYQQKKHFNSRMSAQDGLVNLRGIENLRKDAYEAVLHDLLRQAIPIERNVSRCDYGILPQEPGKVYVLYLNDDGKWFWVFTMCISVWEYDIRASHKNLWRMTVRQSQFLIVRCPMSPYCSHMPQYLLPMKFSSTRVRRLTRILL